MDEGGEWYVLKVHRSLFEFLDRRGLASVAFLSIRFDFCSGFRNSGCNGKFAWTVLRVYTATGGSASMI